MYTQFFIKAIYGYVYLGVCILLGVFAVYLFLQFRIPSRTQFNIFARVETISNRSWSFTSINMFNNSATSATQPMCTYSNNVSIYMDDLKVVSKYFLLDYPQYVKRSHQCGPLPGGGHCLFNANNSTSDAIFYCASHTKLKFKRMLMNRLLLYLPGNQKTANTLTFHQGINMTLRFLTEEIQLFQFHFFAMENCF